MRWRVMTAALAALGSGACGHDDAPVVSPLSSLGPGGYVVMSDAGAAVAAIIDATHPRAIGFGELHARTDRAQVESSLAHFTKDVFPAIGGRLSDLVLETWVVDPSCGQHAQDTTAAVETAMRRPASTKGELARLVDLARAAHVQPRAMHLGCDDYAKVAPPGKDPDIEVMLDLVTRELGRVANEAIAARGADAAAAGTIVATYGGALHNDLYPAKGVESWSFAKQVDDATGGRYVEIDLYVPEYAADDPASQGQPWFPLLAKAAPDHVVVIERGARSYIVLLPKTKTPH